MKHRRCAVVGRWRVPSCAYVDFFPPADSVSRVQPACEWQCICSVRRIVIFCENVISWLKSSPFQLRFQMRDLLIIARSHVRKVGCLSNHRNVVFDQESLNQLRHEFRGHSPQEQIIGQNGLYQTSALIPTSSASSQTVTRQSCMTKVRTWSMSSSFRLVEGLLKWASLSRRVAIFELVVPFLNLCDAHAIVAKTHWIFRMVSTWLLPSFWQNLLQYCCSSRSVIFTECDARCVCTLTHTLAACDWCCLLAGRNPRMHMKVPSTSLPQHTSRASLVSAEKNHVRYFLNKGVYSVWIKLM